jgi:hypothetical protein
MISRRQIALAAPKPEDAPFLPTANATRRGPESDISDIADKVFAGERLSAEDGLRPVQHPNLNDSRCSPIMCAARRPTRTA